MIATMAVDEPVITVVQVEGAVQLFRAEFSSKAAVTVPPLFGQETDGQGASSSPGRHLQSLQVLPPMLPGTPTWPATLASLAASSTPLLRSRLVLRDLGEHRCWRIDRAADYDALNDLARQRINTRAPMEWTS